MRLTKDVLYLLQFRATKYK